MTVKSILRIIIITSTKGKSKSKKYSEKSNQYKLILIPIILESYNQIERYTLLRRVLKKEKEILEVVLNQR